MEKQSFSLKLLSGDFYGQSFIKTVRGPSIKHEHECKILYLITYSYLAVCKNILSFVKDEIEDIT